MAVIIVSVLVGVLLTGLMGGGYYFASGYLYDDRHSEHMFRPSELGYDYENVTIATDDGVRLAGWFVPADPSNSAASRSFRRSNLNATIILVHGHKSSMGAKRPDSRDGTNVSLFDKAGHALHAAGFNLLLIDLRNHGISGDSLPVSLGLNEAKDVLAAAAYLQTRPDIDPTRIGVWGESMGAATAILATATDSQSTGYIKAVAADSAYATARGAIEDTFEKDDVPTPLRFSVVFFLEALTAFDLDDVSPRDAIGRIVVPILLIHSADDTKVRFDHAEQLIESSDSELTELWQTSGVDHVGSHQLEGYARKIADFFGAHL